jgi:diaminopimelate decarboxylase
MGFEMQGAGLACDGVDLTEIAAEHGTPLYVYSGDLFTANIRRLQAAFEGLNALFAYSVKASSNQALLALALREGCGLDIVSGGELQRALAVGADPKGIIFAGVGKTPEEITAALRADIGMFNVESIGEIDHIDKAAEALGVRGRIALRVNPDVRADTHAYITTGTTENKFGIDFKLIDQAMEAVRRAKHVDLIGLHCHIGSQILDAEPYRQAAERVVDIVERLREGGNEITHVNFGGGHGIAYKRDQTALDPTTVAKALRPIVEGLGVRPILEPGRSLIGPAGILLTRVINVKVGVKKRFVIVDAAMNDLIRPPLYQAYHRITAVAAGSAEATRTEVDVVGPVCESTDFLAKDRLMPLPGTGDLLAVHDAGAYGIVMASNYNTRPRVAEVLVLEGRAHLVRRRDTIEEILASENVPESLAKRSDGS